MGWLFRIGTTRKGLVEERTKGWEREGVKSTCVAHCYRGNACSGVLWTVWERIGPDREPERWIGCDLLQYRKNDGWGYKDMDESMGPYYYSCPLGYLDKVPVVTNPGWRDCVRQYHVELAAKRQAKRLRGLLV